MQPNQSTARKRKTEEETLRKHKLISAQASPVAVERRLYLPATFHGNSRKITVIKESDESCLHCAYLYITLPWSWSNALIIQIMSILFVSLSPTINRFVSPFILALIDKDDSINERSNMLSLLTCILYVLRSRRI